MLNKETSCCFTGHRYISRKHLELLKENLPVLITDLAEKGITDFIAGGALGFDTACAQAVIALKEKGLNIRLILALPCKNQTKGWRKNDIELYNQILACADSVIYVSEEYSDGCMKKRNRYMVDNSSACIFYMSAPRGGTAYTVKYALESEIDMYSIITCEKC